MIHINKKPHFPILEKGKIYSHGHRVKKLFGIFFIHETILKCNPHPMVGETGIDSEEEVYMFFDGRWHSYTECFTPSSPPQS